MKKIELSFMKEFKKEMEGVEGIVSSSAPPRYWYSTGNYALNKIISGSFFKGIPQGRITALVGPSQTGKSYLFGNLIKNAQQAGAYAYVIDAENALDDVFMTNIGANVHENYAYSSVITISNVIRAVSGFLNGYKKDYGHDLLNGPQVIIGIDSLDMLTTDQELEHFEHGDNSTDQGLRARLIKQMLRQFVQAIKELNVSILVTGQVYQARQEQILQGEGVWVVNQAVRYALSQIILLKKLKLKNKEKEVTGFRMIAEGFKTRFTKPFQSAEIEVPYDTGMDPFAGLKECLVALGVIEKAGSYWSIVGTDTRFYEKDIGDHADTLLVKGEAFLDVFVSANPTDAELDMETETATETAARRKKIATKAAKGK